MTLSIRNPEADKLARRLVKLSGLLERQQSRVHAQRHRRDSSSCQFVKTGDIITARVKRIIERVDQSTAVFMKVLDSNSAT